jgi:hypothetical protein
LTADDGLIGSAAVEEPANLHITRWADRIRDHHAPLESDDAYAGAQIIPQASCFGKNQEVQTPFPDASYVTGGDGFIAASFVNVMSNAGEIGSGRWS